MATTSRAARVRALPIESIAPNPHNPRRLFDEEPMAVLKESIQKLGILVPVTVYPAERGTGYVLLDGERRWRCAADLKLTQVPAIVIAAPTEEQNIPTMFHIHNVREGWQLMPTALKLKTLIGLLDEDNERKLKELTKLSIPQIRRCKILLTYPKRFQNLMLAPPTERLKADFFIELDRVRRPALSERWRAWTERGDAECIELLLRKYENGVIKAVTEFRRLAEIYRGSVRLNRVRAFLKSFSQFLDEENASIEDLEFDGAQFAKEVKEVRRSASRLLAQLETVEVAAVAADPEAVRTLRRLSRTIDKMLMDALLSGPRDE